MVKTTTTKKENNALRIELLIAHTNGNLSISECALRLGMSVSGFKKLYAKYRDLGKSCLKHGLVGKRANRKTHPHKQKILSLASGKYKAFNISHTCEILEEEEQIKVHSETLRLRLVAAGKPVGKRKKHHRKRREPKPCFGEMLQIDGSFHD